MSLHNAGTYKTSSEKLQNLRTSNQQTNFTIGIIFFFLTSIPNTYTFTSKLFRIRMIIG